MDILKRPALIFFFLCVVVVILVYAIAPAGVNEHANVALVLNLVFLSLISFIAAGTMAYTFIRTGQWYLLLLGMAQLITGMAACAGPLLIGAVRVTPESPSITLAYWAPEALLLISRFYLSGTGNKSAGRRSIPLVAVCFAAILVLFAILVTAAVNGWITPFVLIQGFSVTRQVVIGLGVGSFVIAALIYQGIAIKTGSSFVYWYSLSLGAFGAGIFAILLQPSVGSALGWVGRSLQYLSGLYLAVTALVLVKESRIKAKINGVSAGDSLVTLLSETQTKLKEIERNYEELVRTSPAGIYEVDFRIKKLISVNDAMCRITGYSREELLKMDVTELTDSAGKEHMRSRIESWLKGENPVSNVEYNIRTKDGQTICTLIDVKFTRDEKGLPKGATGIAHDITGRKKAEEALLLNRERYKILADANAALLTDTIPENAVHLIASGVMKHLGCDVFINYILDKKSGRIKLNAYMGLAAQEAANIEWLHLGQAICGCAARDGQPDYFGRHSAQRR